MSLFFYLFLLILVSEKETARILGVFPSPSISHQVAFRPLVYELSKRGHEVVVITTDPAFSKGEAPVNLTEIDVHDISYKIWIEKLMSTTRGNKDQTNDLNNLMLEAVVEIFEAQLRNEEVKNMIADKTQKFDLILAEAAMKFSLVFSHIYKAPVIQVSSFGGITDNYNVLGAPIHPLLYPTSSHQKIYNLTMWDKLNELYNDYTLQRLLEKSEILYDDLIKIFFGNDVPTIKELSNNVHMLFLNIHPMFEGIRPVPPNIIYMGGLHQNPEKELPTDLKSYLDSSKNGVIYFSFGTNVDPSTLPPEKIQVFVKAFSQLPYDILWKWSKDELPGRSANIKISKWLPQSDLLRHPKIKLFITQGGLQSTDEAITAGVPLIGIPMLGDQWFNVEKYVYFKIGLGLNFETLSEAELTQSINKVLEDKSYRKNIVRLRELMRDEPMKPLERAVWWTEYVLRHGGAKHLRAAGANITWWEYLELELVLNLIAAVLAGITSVVILLVFIYKCIIKKFLSGSKSKRA